MALPTHEEELTGPLRDVSMSVFLEQSMHSLGMQLPRVPSLCNRARRPSPPTIATPTAASPHNKLHSAAQQWTG